MYSVKNAFLAMVIIVASSNYLVQFPINDWLTFGALTYPISFLVTELTNRLYGARTARKVVYAGFAAAAFLSVWLATPRIALASGTAFLVSQLLDIFIFNKFRQGQWWFAPLFSSLSASVIDSSLFWTIAFWGEPVPLLTWAIGDTSIKFLIDILMLTPFRFVMKRKEKVVVY